MPWRGPEFLGEFPTLGYEVADWIEEWCVQPDGDHTGEPIRLSDPQLRILLNWYRLDPVTGEFPWRRGQIVLPQKWGKGPTTAMMTCAEAVGPVRFAGWDAKGEPVGRPWSTPWIQLTAISEDQTDNVWRVLQPMIERGPLIELLPDTGLTRINVPGGGLIEPVTSSASSRLGQRITFAPQDETHSWVTKEMRQLAQTQRRNLAGTGGRSFETTNGWNASEHSVAQRTAEAQVNDIWRWHPIPRGDPAVLADLLRMLHELYDASPWVSVDRIAAEYHELALEDRAQANRFFLNWVSSAEDSAVDLDLWRSLVRTGGLTRG